MTAKFDLDGVDGAFALEQLEGVAVMEMLGLVALVVSAYAVSRLLKRILAEPKIPRAHGRPNRRSRRRFAAPSVNTSLVLLRMLPAKQREEIEGNLLELYARSVKDLGIRRARSILFFQVCCTWGALVVPFLARRAVHGWLLKTATDLLRRL